MNPSELFLFESDILNPYKNLAVEQYLLEHLPPDSCTLYLWQNENTVVIGRNQNAWKECRTSLLEEEGGFLARRLSGGGAVFHDIGNLNFTFLMPTKMYSTERQSSVIVNALLPFGIHAELSGRNDILVCGKKCSGNAYYHHNGRSYHHGTILISADMEKLQRYLTPSSAKLQAKSVQSVSSRVLNLCEISTGITIDSLKDTMRESFIQEYGQNADKIPSSFFHTEQMEKLISKYESKEWNYGIHRPFDFHFSESFSWGEITLEMTVIQGLIREITVYTDSMDWKLSTEIQCRLNGIPFSAGCIRNALEDYSVHIATDIYKLLKQQGI